MKAKKLLIPFLLLLSLTAYKSIEQPDYIDVTELRKRYSSGDPTTWPAPELDKSIDKKAFQDIGVLSAVPYPSYISASKATPSFG